MAACYNPNTSSINQNLSTGFLPARQILDRYRISQMTLWRWVADPEMRFPKPTYFGRYRYWNIAEIEAWENERMSTRGVA